tara:strand:- start:1588 stop:2070 length:483 start_codon:yes stop_codon:yes gene_type:complete
MNEKDLLEEITKLEVKIDADKLLCRALEDNDWETLVSWWEAWPDWPVPPRDFLPDNGKGGLMIEKNGQPIVAGFLYQTNSKGILLEWIVSNPDYREEDRNEAVEKLIVEAEKSSKEMGYIYMFTIGRQKNLIAKHKKLGWFVDEKPSHEITKVITSNIKK